MFSLKVDEELELALLQDFHAEPLFALVEQDRERLRRWLPWVDHTKAAADIRVYIKDTLHAFAEGRMLSTAILSNGQVAGGCGLKIDPVNSRCEIGYWIASSFEGRGLITRSARALTHCAQGQLNLHRVAIHCAPGNVRSCAVPERLGFTFEGTLRDYIRCADGYQDMRIYASLTPHSSSQRG